MILSINDAIKRLAEHCIANEYTIKTLDPTCIGKHEDVITMDIRDTGGSRSGLSNNRTTNSSNAKDSYTISKPVGGRYSTEIHTGTLLEVMSDLDLLNRNTELEGSEIVYGGESRFRSDVIRPFWRRS